MADKRRPKILVLRGDRLGDAITASVAATALATLLDQCDIYYGVQNIWAPLFENAPDRIYKVFAFKTADFENEVKAVGFQAVVQLRSDLNEALALRKARIPYRYGLYSKPWSYLYFHQGLRQKRSESKRNEAEYAIELAKAFALRWLRKNPLHSTVTTSEKVGGHAIWNTVRPVCGTSAVDLAELRPLLPRPFEVVHPGMGGSALNLTATQYAEIIKAKLEAGIRVVVTGGRSDQEVVEKVLAVLPDRDAVQVYLNEKGIGMLAGIFSLATKVTAPSTGPLHLAAAVSTPITGYYPPVQVMHPRRWAPFRPAAAAEIFCPDVLCPERFACRGPRCSFHPCLERLPLK